jgi:hypothetical protein
MGTERESRSKDKNFLFELFKIKSGGSITESIAQLQASMEPEDVKLVKQEFAEWKENEPK